MDGWMDGTDGFEFKHGRCPAVPLSRCPTAVPLSRSRSIDRDTRRRAFDHPVIQSLQYAVRRRAGRFFFLIFFCMDRRCPGIKQTNERTPFSFFSFFPFFSFGAGRRPKPVSRSTRPVPLASRPVPQRRTGDHHGDRDVEGGPRRVHARGSRLQGEARRTGGTVRSLARSKTFVYSTTTRVGRRRSRIRTVSRAGAVGWTNE